MIIIYQYCVDVSAAGDCATVETGFIRAARRMRPGRGHAVDYMSRKVRTWLTNSVWR
jgi:hypothetical protein